MLTNLKSNSQSQLETKIKELQRKWIKMQTQKIDAELNIKLRY